ncbi:sensor domain-containing diguanylate cyclase [Glaciecola petra]|uniref:diguanylate cyclase n=1 Tax=Glaciecola petra TaxID=3075602 RepID=A0ABU2ZRQ0_9ALTE|nr:GGDEF domain-containing protein [Aestuariibacter sp. P117]MDT0594698.1 GGDEF domain-containing protein [Aestuariibacter sp. P117]
MNKRISTLLVAVLFIIICIAGYFAIKDLAGSQSQQQQQSVSPIFGLIESELVEPLHIAKTLDKIGVYKEYFNVEEPEEAPLVAQLKEYNELFELEFYVAHEKSRKQYNSDGRVFDLIEGQVIWYFALKEENESEIQAVLGKREDVHLYIDVRQYDEDGNFIGFVGVGKSLNDFIKSFEQYKSQYGHEFIFVNNRDEIVLSSRSDLLPTNSERSDGTIGIKDISDLSWYEEFTSKTQNKIEPSIVVAGEDGDLLVSELSIESLNWSLYLLTPLSARQQEVNQLFAVYAGIGMLSLFFLYKIVYSLVSFYINKMSRKFNYDPLTNLSNRQYASLYFTRSRRENRQTAILLLDLDHLKKVNDTHGHHAGDEIIKSLAQCISENVRPQDLVVRWAGQQFVIIMTGIEKEEAENTAEDCRAAIQAHSITVDSSFVSVTASVGVSYSRDLGDSLDLMMEWSTQALERAKAAGKNIVASK